MSTNPIERVPHKIIRPVTGLQWINFREIWHFRDLLMTLAARDVRLRYRQTALGAIWVVLQPLMAAGVFSFVFGRVARLPSDGVPYFLFAYAGLLAWNAFSNTVTKVSACLVGNSHLVSKVAFPRLILPLSTLIGTLIDFGVAFAMAIVQMAVYHVRPGIGLLLLPFWLTVTLAFGLGLGLAACALNVSYRDVQYIVPVGLQILMYASPVAYAVSAVPSQLRFAYSLNPIAGLLEAFRSCLLGRTLPSPWILAYAIVAAFGVLLVGAIFFRQFERRFADVI